MATAQDIMAWVAELFGQPVPGARNAQLDSLTGGRIMPPPQRADALALNPYLDPARDSATGGFIPRLVPRPRAGVAPMSGPPDTTEAADGPDPFPADATDVPDSVRLRNVPPDERVPPFPEGAVTRGDNPEISPEMARLIAENETRPFRPPPMAPRSPAPQPPRQGREVLRQPSLWQYIDTALAGMAGGRPVLSAVGERAEARNATYDALIQRGASEDLARAITLNPAQFQPILPSLFSPRTAIVNNRLVETATGRVIADLSDRFVPLPEGAGVLNQATGAVGGGGSGTGRQDRAFATGVGRQQAERLGAITNAGRTARDQLANLEAVEAALNTYNRGSMFGTGTLGPGEAAVRRFAQQLGIGNADTIAAGELVTSIQNRMALLMRSPDGGMGMPGALSDADRNFLVAAQPGLGRTPDGNRLMIEVMRRMEQRKIDIARMAEEHATRHGNLNGFEAAVQEFARANPLFADLRTGDATRTAPGPTVPDRARPPPIIGAPPPTRITNDAEFDALPSGARFIGPDGRVRIKP